MVEGPALDQVTARPCAFNYPQSPPPIRKKNRDYCCTVSEKSWTCLSSAFDTWHLQDSLTITNVPLTQSLPTRVRSIIYYKYKYLQGSTLLMQAALLVAIHRANVVVTGEWRGFALTYICKVDFRSALHASPCLRSHVCERDCKNSYAGNSDERGWLEKCPTL